MDVDELGLEKQVRRWKNTAYLGFWAMILLAIMVGVIAPVIYQSMDRGTKVIDRQSQLIDQLSSDVARWRATAELWMLQTPEGRTALDQMRREQLNAPDSDERPG